MTAAATSTAARMTEAAAALLDALDPQQRARASFDFDDLAERTSWAYFPRAHAGLPLHEMDIREQKLAHALISSALSLHAYAKVTAIMALENVLNLIEGRRLDAARDPGRYFVGVFGSPGPDRWAWRLEGHHVSLNFTIVNGDLVSPTPIFLGANPAEVRHGHGPVVRPCGEEAQVARELLASLDAAQHDVATICRVAPPDFVLMNLPIVPDKMLPGEAGALPVIQRAFDAMSQEHRQALRFERAHPHGLPATRLNTPQRDLLSALIDVYVERLPQDLASIERAKIERAGIEAVHFAWAGEQKRGAGHYYRLHGPSFLVEYDNTQDGANHVHAVWRDPDGDFGVDLLRQHVRQGH
jgi:hypothetical protein